MRRIVLSATPPDLNSVWLFPEADTVPVAMSGGVFRNSALVRQVFYNSLRSEYPKATITPTVIDPVRGALELARKRVRS